MTAEQIEALLRAVYERVCGTQDDERTRESVFHMRDWEADLMRLAVIYKDPSQYSVEQCKEAVDGVLLHACGHIMQAARLYGGIVDSFGEQDAARR